MGGVHTVMPRTINIPVSDADVLRHDLELQIHPRIYRRISHSCCILTYIFGLLE